MVAKRFKVIGLWAILLFLVSNGSVFILTALLGTITGALLTVVIVVAFAGFAGYKAASALAGSPGYEKNNALTIVGVTVALLAAFLSTGLNYFMTGEVKFSSGLFTLVAAAIGGYLAERKVRKTKFFGK